MNHQSDQEENFMKSTIDHQDNLNTMFEYDGPRLINH